MNLKDRIMRLFGYENIENILIRISYKWHPPREEKMEQRRKFYFDYGTLYTPIILERHILKDGYTSYLIAKENNIKYVKVVRV